MTRRPCTQTRWHTVRASAAVGTNALAVIASSINDISLRTESPVQWAAILRWRPASCSAARRTGAKMVGPTAQGRPRERRNGWRQSIRFGLAGMGRMSCRWRCSCHNSSEKRNATISSGITRKMPRMMCSITVASVRRSMVLIVEHHAYPRGAAARISGLKKLPNRVSGENPARASVSWHRLSSACNPLFRMFHLVGAMTLCAMHKGLAENVLNHLIGASRLREYAAQSFTG